MPVRTVTQTPLKEPSWLAVALWRLSAGILYTLALLLVPRQLQAAVILLLAALLCLPGSRAALHRHVGAKAGAGFGATVVVALVLGAVMSGEQQASRPISEAKAAGGLVIAAAQAANR